MSFNLFPYSNLHNLNLDWILSQIRAMASTIEAAATQMQTALNDAVLYTSQDKDTGSRRIACTNIHAVSYDSTILSNAEKQQARQNIGAAAADDIPDVSDVVRTSVQDLTSVQQEQARDNIGAAAAADIPDVSDVVRTSVQDLTSAQQVQARNNINASSTSALNAAISRIQTLESNTVKVSEQNLTSEQKTQARTNIGAADANIVSDLVQTSVYNITIEETSTDVFSITGGNRDDALEAHDHGAPVVIVLKTLLNGILCGLASFTYEPDGDIIATLTNIQPVGPGSSYGYKVYITTSNNADVYTVTKFAYKAMPDCGILDTGKTLIVSSNGTPTWDIGNVEIVYATLNPATGVCTPGNGFSFAHLHNSNKIVVAHVSTPSNYLYRFLLGTDRTGKLVFNNMSIYPAGSGTFTKYDMFITIDSSENVEYILNTETFTPAV